MNDTPKHIRDLQLKMWLSKTPGERLYQFIIDNDAMYQALREYKIKNGLPLGDLDPVGEYLKKKKPAKDNKLDFDK
ncbi:MAG: hypothetical protein ABUT20_29770 [Bacteroidota bacterium]